MHSARWNQRILANQLLDTGLFHHLTMGELNHLTAQAREVAYPPHATVLAAGTIPEHALIVLGGSATRLTEGHPVGGVSHGDVLGLTEGTAFRPVETDVVADVPLKAVVVPAAALAAALLRARAS